MRDSLIPKSEEYVSYGICNPLNFISNVYQAIRMVVIIIVFGISLSGTIYGFTQNNLLIGICSAIILAFSCLTLKEAQSAWLIRKEVNRFGRENDKFARENGRLQGITNLLSNENDVFSTENTKLKLTAQKLMENNEQLNINIEHLSKNNEQLNINNEQLAVNLQLLNEEKNNIARENATLKLLTHQLEETKNNLELANNDLKNYLDNLSSENNKLKATTQELTATKLAFEEQIVALRTALEKTKEFVKILVQTGDSYSKFSEKFGADAEKISQLNTDLESTRLDFEKTNQDLKLTAQLLQTMTGTLIKHQERQIARSRGLVVDSDDE